LSTPPPPTDHYSHLQSPIHSSDSTGWLISCPAGPDTAL
jgi:hypothetical protein